MKSIWARLGWLAYWTAGVFALPIFLNGTRRTRVALYDAKTRQILLVKTLISAQKWDLPGGGIHKGESAINAAIREVGEEVGVSLKKTQLKHVGVTRISEQMVSYDVEIFLVAVDKIVPRGGRFEILDKQWFNIDKLPKNTRKNAINLVREVL
jgi:8-oxo-dGTP pyrophosphatase MutT (NUDIX family)